MLNLPPVEVWGRIGERGVGGKTRGKEMDRGEQEKSRLEGAESRRGHGLREGSRRSKD